MQRISTGNRELFDNGAGSLGGVGAFSSGCETRCSSPRTICMFVDEIPESLSELDIVGAKTLLYRRSGVGIAYGSIYIRDYVTGCDHQLDIASHL